VPVLIALSALFAHLYASVARQGRRLWGLVATGVAGTKLKHDFEIGLVADGCGCRAV
jgi:hypothetical protein